MFLDMLKYAKNAKKTYFFFRPIRGLHFWKVNLRGKQNRVIRHCLAHTINDTNFCQVTWICSQMPWKWRKSNTFTSTQKTRGLWKNFTAEKLLKIKFCTHIVNLRSNFQKKNDLQNYSKYGQHFVKVIWRSNLTCWHNLPKVTSP